MTPEPLSNDPALTSPEAGDAAVPVQPRVRNFAEFEAAMLRGAKEMFEDEGLRKAIAARIS